MSTIYEKHSRVWLNPEDSYDKGYIIHSVCVDEYEGKSFDAIDASLSIADCNRVINLDFSVYSKKQLKERLDKVEMFITELYLLQERIREAANLCNFPEEE